MSATRSGWKPRHEQWPSTGPEFTRGIVSAPEDTDLDALAEYFHHHGLPMLDLHNLLDRLRAQTIYRRTLITADDPAAATAGWQDAYLWGAPKAAESTDSGFVSGSQHIQVPRLMGKREAVTPIEKGSTELAAKSRGAATDRSTTLELDLELLNDVVKRISWTPECDGLGHPKPEIVMKALGIAAQVRDVADPPLVATTEDGSIILEWQLPNDSSVEIYMENDSPFPGEVTVAKEGDDTEFTLENVAALATLLRSLARESVRHSRR